MPGREAWTGPVVTLAVVDEVILAELTRYALSDASADEVTPPLTAGDQWTPQRQAWFVDYHRQCRAGLDGPRGEATWAVMVEGLPVGCVRLQRREDERRGVLETGIWLGRSVRERRIAVAAMNAAISEARLWGATEIHADTALTNLPAHALLRRTGFTLTEQSDRIHGTLTL